MTTQSPPAQTSPAAGRRERKKALLRARILEEAFALFEVKGVSQTTVGEICERADVAEKTFFNHFPSRRDLLRELAGEALSRLLDDVAAARKAPGTARERIERFFAHVAAQGEEAGPMHRELLTEIVHVANEGSGDETRRMHEAFGAIVRDGRLAGDVQSPHDDEALTQLVLGAYYVLMFDWVHLEAFALRERATALAALIGDAISAHEVRPSQKSQRSQEEGA